MSIERLSMMAKTEAWCSWSFLVVSSLIHGVVVFKCVLGMVSWFRNGKKIGLRKGSWKIRNPRWNFKKNSKVWIWFKLVCGGNDFRIMIHVLENF